VFDVGDTLGEYTLVSRLSQGGMATLFLGRHRDHGPGGPLVAIKLIHETLSDDWQFVRMFIDEALISVRIRHPNVVRVEELGEHEDRYYLVMEYVQGCSLAELLRTLGKQGRRMKPEIALWIASEVAAGLHAAHEMTGDDGNLLNVIHRDVSPQNVLLSIDGEVKLLDFGIAKAAGRAERTEAGVIKGKVRYMAPEQARGKDLDRRVDLYALGVVLWEMLTMRRFITGKNELEIIKKVREPDVIPPSFRAPGIEPAVDDAVLMALTVDREKRIGSAEELRRVLATVIPDEGVGPAHLSELLRVFMGAQLQKQAQVLPPELAAKIERRTSAPIPLPGEDETTAKRATDDVRSETLTLDTASLDGLTGDTEPREGPPPHPEEPTSGITPPPSAHATLNEPSPFRVADLTHLPAYDHSDEERTVESSGEELQEFIARMREESGLPGKPRRRPGKREPAPIEAPPAEDQRPSPREIATHELARESAARPPPRRRRSFALRVVVVTVVAFAVGASIAVIAVQLLM